MLQANCYTMSRLLLALSCLALLLAVATAEPRYARLAQPKVGCSLTEIVACEAEIEGELDTVQLQYASRKVFCIQIRFVLNV